MAERVLVSTGELFGDGVFETVHLRPSGPWLLTEHLDRLARSATILDLDLPSRAEIEERVTAATAGWAGDEGALRVIATRESFHVTVSSVPAAAIRERSSGVRVKSAPISDRPPWSLSAAKSLSYGENFAARRWARAQGYDDLLLHTADGFALEAPTASIVWLSGSTLGTVPAEQAGILPGTTAARLLALAPSAGLRAEERPITVAELAGVDAIWLASALRGLAEVVSLDGIEKARSPWTPRLLDLLGYRRGES